MFRYIDSENLLSFAEYIEMNAVRDTLIKVLKLIKQAGDLQKVSEIVEAWLSLIDEALEEESEKLDFAYTLAVSRVLGIQK